MAAASTRESTPSFPRMFETWTLAVLRLMNKRSAICRLHILFKVCPGINSEAKAQRIHD